VARTLRQFHPATSNANTADASSNHVALQNHERVSKIPHRFAVSAIEKRIHPRQFSRYHARPNPGLVRAVARAMRWRELLESGQALSIEAIGRLNNCTRSYARSMLELSFLARYRRVGAHRRASTNVDGSPATGIRRASFVGRTAPNFWNQFQNCRLSSILNGLRIELRPHLYALSKSCDGRDTRYSSNPCFVQTIP
jgi:hypothetical protein